MDSPQLWQIGYGFLGGVLSYLVFHGILSLKLFRLQSALGALQGTVLGLRSQSYVAKRWDRRDQEQQAFEQMLRNKPAPSRRFDNDALVYDPNEH